MKTANKNEEAASRLIKALNEKAPDGEIGQALAWFGKSKAKWGAKLGYKAVDPKIIRDKQGNLAELLIDYCADRVYEGRFPSDARALLALDEALLACSGKVEISNFKKLGLLAGKHEFEWVKPILEREWLPQFGADEEIENDDGERMSPLASSFLGAGLASFRWLLEQKPGISFKTRFLSDQGGRMESADNFGDLRGHPALPRELLGASNELGALWDRYVRDPERALGQLCAEREKIWRRESYERLDGSHFSVRSAALRDLNEQARAKRVALFKEAGQALLYSDSEGQTQKALDFVLDNLDLASSVEVDAGFTLARRFIARICPQYDCYGDKSAEFVEMKRQALKLLIAGMGPLCAEKTIVRGAGQIVNLFNDLAASAQMHDVCAWLVCEGHDAQGQTVRFWDPEDPSSRPMSTFCLKELAQVGRNKQRQGELVEGFDKFSERFSLDLGKVYPVTLYRRQEEEFFVQEMSVAEMFETYHKERWETLENRRDPGSSWVGRFKLLPLELEALPEFCERMRREAELEKQRQAEQRLLEKEREAREAEEREKHRKKREFEDLKEAFGDSKLCRELNFELVAPLRGMPGREKSKSQALNLLSKAQSVVLTGRAGNGKSTLSASLAEDLEREGKILVSVPSSAVRSSDSFVEGAHRAIKKWTDAYFELAPKARERIVFFVDEAHILAGEKHTTAASSTNAMQFLKPYLDRSKPADKRLRILAATTDAEYDEAIKTDEAFARRLARVRVEALSLEETLAGLASEAGKKAFVDEGIDLSQPEDFGKFAKLVGELSERYEINLDFPRKLIEALHYLLVNETPAQYLAKGQDYVKRKYCEYRRIPPEMALDRTPADSPYLGLGSALGARVVDQGHATGALAALALSTLNRQGGQGRPKSAILVGPTGVGKTESAEFLAKSLRLPFLKLAFGERAQAGENLARLADFVGKNYAGVALLDEIEKGDQASFDALLNLLDKGEIISSASGPAKCGNVLVLMTSNAACDILDKARQRLGEMAPGAALNEDCVREVLVASGFRREFLGRVDMVLDYGHLTPRAALSAAAAALEESKSQLLAGRGVELEIGEALLESWARKGLESRAGGRAVGKEVARSVGRLMSDPLICSRLGAGVKVKADAAEGGGVKISLSEQGAEVFASEVAPEPDMRAFSKLALLHALSELGMENKALGGYLSDRQVEPRAEGKAKPARRPRQPKP